MSQNVSVVNDAVERGVKLITDFNRSLAHNEGEKQFSLQIVNDYTAHFPSYKKSVLLNQVKLSFSV